MDQVIETAEFKVKRTFPVKRATLFRLWGSAEHVKEWFTPKPLTTPHAKVEFKAGGAFDVCMRMPDGTEHWMRGIFTEIVPDEKLVFETKVGGPDGHFLFSALTTVRFFDEGQHCRLEVKQDYQIFDPAARAMIGGASQGWEATLDQLEQHAMRSAVFAMFTLRRTYDAPAALVWKALTDIEAKAKWFNGGDNWTLVERAMDVRVGGREIAKGQWKNGMTTCFDAVYQDVVPLRRLVYSYQMFKDDQKLSVSQATFQLSEEGAKTNLIMTEQGVFLDGYDDAGAREEGSSFLLDALGRSLQA